MRPLKEGGGTTTTYPFEVWHYRYIEGVGADIDIEFVDPHNSGEYRIALRETEKDALFTTVGAGQTWFEMEGLETRGGRLRSSDMMRGSGLEGDSIGNRYSNPFLKLEQYVNLQRPPAIKFEKLKVMVDTEVSYDQLPFQYTQHVFRYTDKTVLVPITVEIDTRDLSYRTLPGSGSVRATVNIYGRVETLTREIAYEFEDVMVSDLRETDQKVAHSLYQRFLPLDRGRYKLKLVLENLESGRIGSTEGLIKGETAGGPGRLRASTIMLANRIADPEGKESIPDPFNTSSGYKIYPNVRHQFLRGNPLGVYLEMYGLTLDQASGRPSVKVSYQIVDAKGHTQEQNDIGIRSDGKNGTLSMLWPASRLPAGKYRLLFDVQDQLSGETLHLETAFELLEKN